MQKKEKGIHAVLKRIYRSKFTWEWRKYPQPGLYWWEADSTIAETTSQQPDGSLRIDIVGRFGKLSLLLQPHKKLQLKSHTYLKYKEQHCN